MVWNWETDNVAYKLDEDIDDLYDILDMYRRNGVPDKQFRGRLADNISFRLKREEAELNRSGMLIAALVSNPGRVDCAALADRYVSMYEKLPPEEKAAPASGRSKKPKSTTSGNRKATAKKTTAKKTAARRY